MWKGRVCDDAIYVIKNLKTPLVGQPVIEVLGIIRFMNEVAVPETDYTSEYPKLFLCLGSVSGEHTIRVVPDSVPEAVATPRKIPTPIRQALNKNWTALERRE